MSAPTNMLEEVIGTSDEVLGEQALRSLKKRRDFKTHLFIYLVVNVTIWAVWLILGVTSHSWWPWAIFPTLGWGIGLAANAWDVYMRRLSPKRTSTRRSGASKARERRHGITPAGEPPAP